MSFIFNISAFTNIGTVRSVNQDRILANQNLMDVGQLDLLNQQHAICFVADGVGGNKAGEYASQFVLEKIKANTGLLKENPIHFLNEINERLISETKNNIDTIGASTTLSGIYFKDDNIEILNAGDSEIWLLRNDIFFKLTNDQVFDEFQKNSPLISYFGGKENCLNIESQSSISELADSDIFLICSDGLFKSINYKIAESILKADKALPKKVEKILENCMTEGMQDNTSVILIECKLISHE